jgi:glyoxylase-like metal-dependent hydrolase (beta-lactamase superfamily II)
MPGSSTIGTSRSSARTPTCQFAIADLKISRIEDFVDPAIDPTFLFPDLPAEVITANLDWLAPNFIDRVTRKLDIHIQSWVIDTGRYRLLVDACGGNDKHRPFFPVFDQAKRPFLANLAGAGYAPEDIDFVFCTHLHVDHVGWNTRLDNGLWVPTFPNARYLFSETEYRHTDPAGRLSGGPKEQDVIFYDSVVPVVEAGLSILINGVHEITEQLLIQPAPGHSPGHCILLASCGMKTALFSGDVLHHPLQIAAPSVNSFACEDAIQARKTRLRILEECAEYGYLLVPAHFASPHLGRITKRGSNFSFIPGPS